MVPVLDELKLHKFHKFIFYTSYIYVYFDKVNYLHRQRLLTLSRKKLYILPLNDDILKAFIFILTVEKIIIKCRHFNFTNEINLSKLYIIKLMTVLLA